MADDRPFDLSERFPYLRPARAYTDKLLVLAPQQDDGYDWLIRLGSTFGDLAGLKAVQARLATAELDLGREDTEYRELLAGTGLDKRKQEMTDGNKLADESLAAVAGRTDATYAAAVAELVSAPMAGRAFGLPADPDELVTLAETAATAAPSAGSRRTLRTALTFRAHERLTKADPRYRAAADATACSLATTLLELVLADGGPLAELATADPDVKRVRELTAEQAGRMPDDLGPAAWAFLAGDPVADKLTAHLRGELPTLERAVGRKTSPPTVSGLMSEFTEKRLTGQSPTLADLNAELEKHKLPKLPPLR